MGVRRMSEKASSIVQSSGGTWRFHLGTMRVHDDHVSSGHRTSSRCPVCSHGLAGTLEKLEETRTSVVVAKGDGANKEEDTAPPRSNGDGDGRNPMPW